MYIVFRRGEAQGRRPPCGLPAQDRAARPARLQLHPLRKVYWGQVQGKAPRRGHSLPFGRLPL